MPRDNLLALESPDTTTPLFALLTDIDGCLSTLGLEQMLHLFLEKLFTLSNTDANEITLNRNKFESDFLKQFKTLHSTLIQHIEEKITAGSKILLGSVSARQTPFVDYFNTFCTEGGVRPTTNLIMESLLTIIRDIEPSALFLDSLCADATHGVQWGFSYQKITDYYEHLFARMIFKNENTINITSKISQKILDETTTPEERKNEMKEFFALVISEVLNPEEKTIKTPILHDDKTPIYIMQIQKAAEKFRSQGFHGPLEVMIIDDKWDLLMSSSIFFDDYSALLPPGITVFFHEYQSGAFTGRCLITNQTDEGIALNDDEIYKATRYLQLLLHHYHPRDLAKFEDWIAAEEPLSVERLVYPSLTDAKITHYIEYVNNLIKKREDPEAIQAISGSEDTTSEHSEDPTDPAGLSHYFYIPPITPLADAPKNSQQAPIGENPFSISAEVKSGAYPTFS